MSKVKLTSSVSTEVIGRASATDNQARSMGNEPIMYIPGFAYYVPKQYAHQVPSAQEGFAPSKRVFAVELRPTAEGLVPTGNLTAIKLSAINQTYLGEVKEGADAPLIKCETNAEGLNRPVKEKIEGYDLPTYNRCVPGVKGLSMEDDKDGNHLIKVRFDMIYWADRQIQGYTPKFVESGSRDMLVDEDEVLQLDQTNMWIWRTEAAGGRVDLTLDDILDKNLPHREELFVK